jgi:NADH-quinone oxidoreductase subunit N
MLNEFLILMKQELAVTLIIFILLIIKIGKGIRNESLLSLIQVLLLFNFIVGFFFIQEGSLFDGMYQTNALMAFQKNILSFGTYLISLLFAGWLKKTPHLSEFFILILAALLGMFFLISSGNLLMFFLSLELATIPVAALVNFDLEKKISAEGAMKLILSSAFSSGILLFGISLIYGATGTISFAELPHLIAVGPLQILAFIFVFTAFAFKLAVVPFHLYTADVYEGAPVAVTSFLSVISKGSIAFILMTALYKVFQPLHAVSYDLLVILSITSMVIGNLFALRQNNLKRFLAFSSIAQVGFILVGISAATTQGLAAVVYFILIYIFSNLGAFGVIGIISSATGKENMTDYKNLYQNNKLLSWVLALSLFSLAGIPPTAGFFGKLFLITAGAETGKVWFIVIVVLNLVVSLYYYLKVVKSMFMDKNDHPVETVIISRSAKLGLIICAAGIILIGLISWVYDYILQLV